MKVTVCPLQIADPKKEIKKKKNVKRSKTVVQSLPRVRLERLVRLLRVPFQLLRLLRLSQFLLRRKLWPTNHGQTVSRPGYQPITFYLSSGELPNRLDRCNADLEVIGDKPILFQ